MKRLLLLLCLLTAALRLSAQTAAPATTLSGTVRDAAGQPLPGANVFLKTTFDGATADSLGRFRFSTRKTGTLPLVVTLLGYEPQEQPVVLDGSARRLTLVLKPVRNQLGDVTITAGAFEASESRTTVLKPLDIVTTAGALADVSGALNTLPGTTRNGEEGKLFVRGGAAGETRQYLDGLPLQSPYNASVSGVPSRGRFSPMLFKGTVFSTGGYSAEFGQALSAVVGLNSTDLPAETQTGISLLSVGLSLSHQQRWERSSVAVTGDYINLQPYYGLVPQRFGWRVAPQSLGGSVAVRQRTGELGMLKLYGAFTRQEMALTQADPGYPGGQRPVALLSNNEYVNASFRSPLKRGWSLQTGLAGTRDEQDVRPDVQRVHELEQSLLGRVVVTNDSASAYWNLKLGTELLGQRYQMRYQATPETAALQSGFTEQRAAAFAESDISLSNELVARAGVRAEYSAVLGRWNAAPRLALAYQLGEGTQVSGAFGLFYQTPANDLLRAAHSSPNLRFERATHYLLTYQRSHDDRTLRAEAYYKDYAHLTRYNPAAPFDPTAYHTTGTGYARGLDLFWRDKKTFKKTDYWVSYGLLDTRRQQRTDPVLAVPTFASRHNLSVVGKYWISQLHTQVSGTYSYGSPRAYFDPNRPGYNQRRTPSYQDVSLSVSYLTTIRKNLTIVYASCSNVLGRNNVYGYRYAATPDAAGRYEGVAVTPSAPRMLFVGLLISINKHRPADTETAPD
ncbi:TonB-dependent receptor [Hymenobacter busanensis]|uniref:TonB-dependent receptor n=1 Tax=Hymenobacter busanensis TaxID=2607656 RepID=A0A7L5A139_9BACT|nr:TonB-dependent receptor [Hymenobacter busanensis]KAA9327048.1 TonB-dependent receptor [Hymenobacter busanensis]QHJ09499.1 TonB-dependent receptor [Hymenobacter busanensis]